MTHIVNKLGGVLREVADEEEARRKEKQQAKAIAGVRKPRNLKQRTTEGGAGHEGETATAAAAVEQQTGQQETAESLTSPSSTSNQSIQSL